VLAGAILIVLLHATIDDLPAPGTDRQLVPEAAPEFAAEPFIATAYCKGTVTRSGIEVRSGIAAADPDLLPVGSVVDVSGVGAYDGIYTILDTGPAVRGHHLDIYMWSCYDALDFGKQDVLVRVFRLGWNPEQSDPKAIAEELETRERDLPARLAERPLVGRYPRFLEGLRAPR
jgi:3D (Asp-Asp-Asp) domain-containing protein